MINRRRFLGSLGAAGAAVLLTPYLPAGRAARGERLRAVPHPLYREPIADPNAIPRFVQPLAVPAERGLRVNATAGGAYPFVMGETVQDVLGVGLPTAVWGYGRAGTDVSYPGPTVVARRDHPIELRWANHLPKRHLLPVDTTLHWAFGHNGLSIAEAGVPAVAHLHGGHVDAAFDGGPEQWFTARGDTGADFASAASRYENSQEAATLWYHDHTLGITRLNVNAGLAGFYLLRDDHEMELMESGGLPAERHEVELVIQDRTFYPDGRLAYPDAPHPSPDWHGGPSHLVDFYGDVILVNGRAWPYLRVEPRPYRFRLLNGSDSRTYALAITPPTGSPATMVAIGTDGGFLDSPAPLSGPLVLSSGERADIVVDFSAHAGQTLTMRNGAFTPFPLGVPPSPTAAEVLQLRVDLPLDRGSAPPVTLVERLRDTPFEVPGPPAVTRRLILGERLDHYGRIQTLLGTAEHGHLTYSDPVTETPQRGQVEVWEFYNDMLTAHPIHLHLVAFEVLDRAPFIAVKDPGTGAMRDIQGGPRQPPFPQERGPKDTVLCYPGEVTRIRARFDRSGDYVWHCHNLSHEDNEMMRPLQVG
ncbi:MAG: spore coat protein manganese oxidase [Actinomycetota bacterium]|nr:spore coat protein manganese oxidase [Actinomycetota bacterium]